ncbi:MAG: hypothetical protein WCH62_00475 [Candidatus Omnitrophota bacterium]
MDNPRNIFIFVGQFILCLFLLLLFSNWVFPFTTDSITYITTAENISHFKGQLFSNYLIAPAEVDVLPSFLAPPGYPILIAAFKFIGIDAYKASLILPRVGFLFLPLLFFMVFKRLMPMSVAWVTAFVCTFMFSTLKCSLIAWSDVPYLCFSLLSLIAVFKVIEKKDKISVFIVLLAGILAGYSFLIRYVGITLIVSIGIGFLASVFLSVFSLKDFIRIFRVFALGVLLVVLPYIARNILVFGTIQAYRMPPSDVAFCDNVHAYLRTLAEMIFTNPSFEYVILLIILFLLIGFIVVGKSLVRNNPGRFLCALILFFYFFLNSIFVVGYKTIYFGPEAIDDRYLLQVAWILMGFLTYMVYLFLKKLNSLYRTDIKSVTGLLLLVFMLVQVFPAVDFYERQNKIKNLSLKVEHYISLVKNLPADCVIVSNIFEMTYYFSRRNVRMVTNYTPYGFWKLLGQTRKFVVFLIKEEEFLSPSWKYLPMWQHPEGYYKAFSDSSVDLIVPSFNK